MGYTTDFYGKLTLSQPLTVAQFTYINKLAETRRMKRDPQKLLELYGYNNGHPDRTKTSPENYFGRDGEFFVGATGYGGQDTDASVIDYNTPPGQLGYDVENFDRRWKENEKRIKNGTCQPGLWLKWEIIDEDGNQFLQWNNAEKFYYYTEWLQYLIKNFFEPWGVKLNGEIEWQGEERSDMGKIVVKDNEVKVLQAKITFGEDEED